MEKQNISVDPQDAQDNKIMGVLAYLGILILVPILKAKESPFARFHVNQGLVLFIASFAYSTVVWIVTFVLTMISPSLSLIGSLLSIVSIGFLVLIVLGIINAVNGVTKELPIIGKYRIIK